MSINARIKTKRDTTANWDAATGFIPLAGEIIVYTDYETMEEDGETITIPNMKIGDGLAYVQDLPFVDKKIRSILTTHIQDQDIHTTLAEKLFWNNKINVDDTEEQITGELVDETLVLTRD